MDEKKILLCKGGTVFVISERNNAEFFLRTARESFGDEKVLVVNIWGLDESAIAQICVWYGRLESNNLLHLLTDFIKARIVDYTDSEWWDKMQRLYGIMGVKQ